MMASLVTPTQWPPLTPSLSPCVKAMARPISVHARFKALYVSKCRHTTPETPSLYQFLFACKVLILSPIKGTKKFHKFLSK
jgi:hypothetical protein